MEDLKTIKILGISVASLDQKQALRVFEELLDSEGCSQIVTLNPEMMIEAGKDESYFRLLEESSLVLPDGIGVVYASRMVGRALAERITGIDFARAALEILAKRGSSVFFLGAKPGVAQTAADRLSEEMKTLRVAGARDGYFRPEEEAAVVDEINSSGAELLLLALGAPKQEFFTHKYRDRLKCRAAIGVGGSFDVWSGTLKRAPEFYIRHNIEWLYRLFQEPVRIKRVIRLPFFLLKAALYKEK